MSLRGISIIQTTALLFEQFRGGWGGEKEIESTSLSLVAEDSNIAPIFRPASKKDGMLEARRLVYWAGSFSQPQGVDARQSIRAKHSFHRTLCVFCSVAALSHVLAHIGPGVGQDVAHSSFRGVKPSERVDSKATDPVLHAPLP